MRKFKRIYFVILFLTALLITAAKKDVAAIATGPLHAFNLLSFQKDTIPQKSVAKDTIPQVVKDTIPPKDSIKITDSSNLNTDTSLRAKKDTFTLKISKDTLSAPVTYFAQDSVVGLVDTKLITLYGKAKTEYQDMTLTAPVISINQATHMINAQAGKDSVGDIETYAEMKQAENEFKAEGMEYNFKSQQGITKGTITQQGEMFIHSDIVKKVDENTMYGMGTFFTTCNLDHPHFGFRAHRSKIINKKLAVTGAVRPEFDSVPVPIYLPFGIYPLYQGRHSGLMQPSFERNDVEGLGLSRLGYYQVVNDYWDVQLYGNIYSYGSWSVNVNPTYRKIYKYSGSFNFGLQNTRRARRDDPDFSSVKTYTVNWAHSSDTRSRPGVSFSANVNASSTKYNENVPNSNLVNFQNVMGSSITYSKSWIDKPLNLTLSATHNQNNASRLMTINLPNAGFTVSTLYPLQKKESVGAKKWYEQLGIGYSGSFQNAIAFYDTLDTRQYRNGISKFRYMLDTTQWNANHNMPITLSLPPILGGAVVVAPSISYSQQWLDRSTTHYYDEDLDTVQSINQKRIFIKQQMSMGLSFNTALYGTYQMKGAKLLAMRHVIRPTFGLSYTPDLNKNNWEYIKTSDTTFGWFDKLAGLSARPLDRFTTRKFGGINFGLDNNLEIKVKAKKKKSDDTDSTESNSDTKVDENGIKKVRLIDGFGFNSSYNMFADTMKLSPFNLYFRTNLFEKINISANANLVPYKFDSQGNMLKEYAWQGGGFKLGTIQSANVSMSTSFQSKAKDPEKEKKRQEAINQQMNDPMLQQDQQRLLEYMRQNPAEFVDFNTPWSINLSYSLNYYKGYNTGTGQTNNGITSSTSFNGSFNLTPKWNFSVNGFYDFKTSKIQTFSMSISRDLHCWQMSINVTPVGLYRYFNFTISPKSGLLQDLKINRNRSFYNGPGY